MLYPYGYGNIYRGRLAEQGAFRYKTEAIREAKEACERTERINEQVDRPLDERSEVFVAFDYRTGEIIGGALSERLRRGLTE